MIDTFPNDGLKHWVIRSAQRKILFVIIYTSKNASTSKSNSLQIQRVMLKVSHEGEIDSSLKVLLRLTKVNKKVIEGSIE